MSSPTNAGLLIPRCTFEFDPAGIGSLEEFSLVIPRSDSEAAIAMPVPLDKMYMPSPKHTTIDRCIGKCAVTNVGGSIRREDTEDAITIRFGFTPLVPPGEVPDDVVNYREKMNYRLAPRMPQYEARHKIDRKIAKILRIQYQFGVPQADYDLGVPASPARFSYYGGKDLGEPRFVATREFDQTLRAIGRNRKTAVALSNTAYEYLAFLDPELMNSRTFEIARVIIGHYGKVFSNGEGSLGMHGDAYFTDTEIEKHVNDQDTYRRYQPGDVYNCAGHNLDQVPGARMLALVSVGMVARACRWVRAQQAIG